MRHVTMQVFVLLVGLFPFFMSLFFPPIEFWVSVGFYVSFVLSCYVYTPLPGIYVSLRF